MPSSPPCCLPSEVLKSPRSLLTTSPSILWAPLSLVFLSFPCFPQLSPLSASAKYEAYKCVSKWQCDYQEKENIWCSEEKGELFWKKDKKTTREYILLTILPCKSQFIICMKNFLSLQYDPGLLCYQDNSVIVPRQQADSAALSKHIGISPNSKLQIRNFKPNILPEARQTQVLPWVLKPN